MALFKPVENTIAYFKAGFMGEAGSGKTHTSALCAIGLVQHLKKLGIAGAEKPVFMLDTETGRSWVKPMFDEAGIPFHAYPTRAFKDLVPAVREAEKEASLLFIDSITHFWEELQTSYMKRLSFKYKREVTALEFQDWNYIKTTWRTFSDAYVTSHLHCILCGRLGHEYEQTQDERGKKKIEKSGVKMQAEKGLGYEPNILVWMERDLNLATREQTRTATILKDRSRRLDGKTFSQPTFATFLPHIEFMDLGGKHETVDTTRNSDDTMPVDEGAPLSDLKSIRRQIVLDEIQALLVDHYPSQAAEDKKQKAALIKEHFHTTSWTEIEKLMPLVQLQADYDSLHRALTGEASRYGVPDAVPVEEQKLDDEIPALAEAPAETAEAEEVDDRTIILHDFEAALSAFPGNSTRISQLRKTWETTFEQNGFDPAWMAKVDAAVAKARKSRPVGLKSQLKTSVENARAEAAE